LVSAIKKVPADTSFDPQDLEFELTESFLMDDVPRFQSILAELRLLRVTIALQFA